MDAHKRSADRTNYFRRATAIERDHLVQFGSTRARLSSAGLFRHLSSRLAYNNESRFVSDPIWCAILITRPRKESRSDSRKWPAKGRGFDARNARIDLSSIIVANRGAIKTGEIDAAWKEKCPEPHPVGAALGRHQRRFWQGSFGRSKPELASEGCRRGDRGQREGPVGRRQSEPLIARPIRPELPVAGRPDSRRSVRRGAGSNNR